MIKKSITCLCAACLLFSLASCRSSKEVATLSELNGEWKIVEINGSAVVLNENQEHPTIGFETATGKVYGNSGCNRIMGTFDTQVKPGNLNLDALAGTRMMCPDMTLETNVLNALKNVKGYKKIDQTMALTNSHNRPVVILSPQTIVSQIAELDGEWKISEVNGKALPADMENEPYLHFDIKNKRLHGNAGCNMINGGFVIQNDQPKSISFPAVAATMMACPDMQTERTVLDALNNVKTFGFPDNKSAGLYNKEGELILKLTK